MRKIDILAAKAALRSAGEQFGCPFGLPEFRGAHDHAGKPWRQRQLPKLPAHVGHAPIAVDRSKSNQERPGFGQRRTRG